MPLINEDPADLVLFAEDTKLFKMIKIKNDKLLLIKGIKRCSKVV